ncbi:MAG: insulinase family protein [Phycisphaerales bacterium]|nr:insulinase family protein [Phycisphaerales bacterium]
MLHPVSFESRLQPSALSRRCLRWRVVPFAVGAMACLIPHLTAAAPLQLQTDPPASTSLSPSTPTSIPPASIVRSVIHHRASNVYTISIRGQRILVHLRPMPEATGISLCIRLLGGELSETAQTRGLTAAVVAAWTRPDTDASTTQPANLRSAVTPESVAFTPRTLESPDALSKALTNFASMIVAPTLDEPRFQTAHRQTLSRARAVGSPGFAAVVQAMRQSTDPRAGGPLSTHVERWTPDAAREHLTTLASNAPIEIAIAGNITLAQALPIIQQCLAPIADAQPAAHVTPTFNRAADRDISTGVVAAAFPVPEGPIVQVLLPGPDIDDLAAVRQFAVVAQYLQSELDAAFKAQPRPASVIGSVVIPSRGLKNLGTVMLTIRLKNPEPEPTLADNPDNQPVAQTFQQPEAIAAEVRSVLEVVLSRCADANQIDQPKLTTAIDAITAQAAQRLSDPDYWASVLSFTRFYAINPDDLAHAARHYQTITRADIASRIATLGPGTTRTRFVVLVPPPPSSPKVLPVDKPQSTEDR